MDSAPGVLVGSAVDVPVPIGGEVTVRLEAGVSMAGISVAGDVDRGVAVGVAVAVVRMVVGVSIEVREKVSVSATVDGNSKVEIGVGVGMDVSVVTGVKSEGDVRVSWAAQVALLPRSILMPTNNRETISQ